MGVLEAWSVALEVPDLKPGILFYEHAGLIGQVASDIARFYCDGQDQPAIVLSRGGDRKRLHHICLRADDLEGTAARVPSAGGSVTNPPTGWSHDGLWVLDPHGMLIHLVHTPAPSALVAGPPFEINSAGRIVRNRRSGVRPLKSYGAVKPLRLGHILVFTPDVDASVRFVTAGLGMGLSDRSQDIIAFCCARRNSDHHVVAFAKSSAVGFHHASFEVRDPDEVGRGGATLAAKSQRGHWGFGRHTIGSNFFHYVQDPWGSWLEYYSDIDHIDDYDLWTPTNYDLEDSLASWGPSLPGDFVHNYEAEPNDRFAADKR